MLQPPAWSTALTGFPRKGDGRSGLGASVCSRLTFSTPAQLPSPRGAEPWASMGFKWAGPVQPRARALLRPAPCLHPARVRPAGRACAWAGESSSREEHPSPACPELGPRALPSGKNELLFTPWAGSRLLAARPVQKHCSAVAPADSFAPRSRPGPQATGSPRGQAAPELPRGSKTRPPAARPGPGQRPPRPPPPRAAPAPPPRCQSGAPPGPPARPGSAAAIGRGPRRRLCRRPPLAAGAPVPHALRLRLLLL